MALKLQRVDFSLEDKFKIAKILSDIGVDYIEGGWPGANPIDTDGNHRF